jgi:hypothetical protein
VKVHSPLRWLQPWNLKGPAEVEEGRDQKILAQSQHREKTTLVPFSEVQGSDGGAGAASRYAVPRRLNTPATFFETCEIAIRRAIPNAYPRLPGL